MNNYKLLERVTSQRNPSGVGRKLKAEIDTDSLEKAEEHFRKLCNTGFVTKTGYRHIDYRIIVNNEGLKS